MSSSLGARTRGVRIAFAFAALFLMNAAALAWLPVWLDGRGLSGQAVGLVIALVMLARFVGAPSGGFAADATGRPVLVLVVAAAALLAGLLVLPLAGAPWGYAAAALILGLGFGPAVPVLEAITVRGAQSGGPPFGPMRAVGTAAFIVGALAVGELVRARGTDVIIVWLAATAAAFFLATFLLPRPAARPARGAPREPVAPALLAPPLLLAFAASGLIQGSHAFYYSFGSLAWRAQGLSDATIGALWAWGGVAEVALLWQARRVERLGPARLLALGGGAATLRWLLMGLSPGVPALIALQVLHAATFGAAHLGFILFVREHAPPHAAATAQSVNSALTFGGALAAATAVSGVLYDRVGALGYMGMAVPAAAGLALALGLARRIAGVPAERG